MSELLAVIEGEVIGRLSADRAGAAFVCVEHMLDMLAEIARALPDRISEARDQAIEDGLARSVVVPLAKQLITHTSERSRVIAARR